MLPAAECLADVVARMLPYWYDGIVPDLAAGRTTLVAAHGNSLRALVKHLDGISDEDIVELNIPTGVPLLYELDADLRPVSRRYLGDPEAAKMWGGAYRVPGTAGPGKPGQIGMEITDEGMTVVIVEQDVAMAKRVSKRLYCFQEGLVSLQGHSESLTQEAISQAYFGV